jgi:protein involved in polysaccharide export with SLBB domain
VAPADIPKIKEMLKEVPAEKKPAETPEKPKEALVPPAKEAPAAKEKSEIEAILSGKIPTTVSTDLVQFGYDLFQTTVSTFAPVTDVPVGPDYVIGPGDRFTIFIWGRFDLSYQVEVNRDGEISLPKIGALKVWGLTFSQLKDYLFAEISKYYKEFQLNLTMDRLRTIRVYVVGEAVTPGSYALSSLSTVYNALFAAGGPSKRGTMRKIQLIRNGKRIQTIDLYDFLLKGDKSQDERLQSGDTIFIPTIGPIAGIAGNVKRPAIYELKGSVTLGELIELAGGVTPFGYLQRVQIERVEAHEKRIVADFNLSPFAKGEAEVPELSVRLQDADMVKIFPIFPVMQKVVYLEGHVKRPGGYEFKEGMRLLEVIPSIGDLLPEPYLKYAHIIRLIPPDFRPYTIPVNLERLYLENDQGQNLPLQEHDRVVIFGKREMREIPRATATGEVSKPGKYPLIANMRVKDLIYQAGNLKRSAYLLEAEITRLVKTEKGVTSKIINIDLNEALKENPQHDILLEEDDYLFVRQIPKWYVDKTITVTGEVKFPGAYTFQKGDRLSSVLERAGGFTPQAYLPGGFFTRVSVRTVQEQRIREFIAEQERAILTESARAAEAALSREEAEQRQRALAQRRELIARLSAAMVTGRVVIKMLPLDKFKGSEYDLELEDGDTLNIPMTPSSVLVMGRVYNPNAILYTEDKPLEYYLNKVGGPAENADKKRIYLVKADGSVLSRTQSSSWGFSWNSETHRWVSGGFMSAKMAPGDTILVPEKYERINWVRELRDWTQIIFQLAMAAGVIVAISK